MHRFISSIDLYEFEWDEPNGKLMVRFQPNRRARNDSLLNVVSLLALAYDGRTFVSRETFVPVVGNEHEPSFTLALDIPLAPTATEIARAALSTKRFFGRGAGYRGLVPSYLPSSYAYTGFSGLLNRADRTAFTAQITNFHYLEVGAPPAVISALRKRLRELIPARERFRWRLTSRTARNRARAATQFIW